MSKKKNVSVNDVVRLSTKTERGIVSTEYMIVESIVNDVINPNAPTSLPVSEAEKVSRKSVLSPPSTSVKVDQNDVYSGDKVVIKTVSGTTVKLYEFTVASHPNKDVFEAVGGGQFDFNTDDDIQKIEIYLVEPELDDDRDANIEISYDEIEKGMLMNSWWNSGDVAYSTEGIAHKETSYGWATVHGELVALKGEDYHYAPDEDYMNLTAWVRVFDHTKIEPGMLICVRVFLDDVTLTRTGLAMVVNHNGVYTGDFEPLYKVDEETSELYLFVKENHYKEKNVHI